MCSEQNNQKCKIGKKKGPSHVAIPPSCSSSWRLTKCWLLFKRRPVSNSILIAFLIFYFKSHTLKGTQHFNLPLFGIVYLHHLKYFKYIYIHIPWIEKVSCIFAKPAGLEMHAGWNPKLIITAKGIGRLESRFKASKEHTGKRGEEGKDGR